MLLIRIHLCIPPDATTELDSVARVLERLQKARRGQAELTPVLWHDLPLNKAAALADDVAVVLSDDHGVDVSVFVLGESLGFDGELRQPNAEGEYYGSAVEAEFALMTAAHAASPDGRPLILVYRRRVLRPVGLLLEEDEGDAEASEPALTPAEEADTPVGEFAAGPLAEAAGSLAANERFDGPADLEALLELHLGHVLQTLLGADAEAIPEPEPVTVAAVDADVLEWDVDELDEDVEDKYRTLAEADASDEDGLEDQVDVEEDDEDEDEEEEDVAEDDVVEGEEADDDEEVDATNFEAINPPPEADEGLATDAEVIEQAFAAHAQSQEPVPAPLPGEAAAQDSNTWKLVAAVLVLVVGLVLFADGFRQRKLAADATEAADHAREASQAAREQADALAGPQGDAVALPNEFITLPGDPTNIVPPELPPTEAALAADLAAARADLGLALMNRAEAYFSANDPLRAAIASERAVGYATTGWRTDASIVASPAAWSYSTTLNVRQMYMRQTLGHAEALVTTGLSTLTPRALALSPTADLMAMSDTSLDLWNLSTGSRVAHLGGRVSSLGFSADGATLMTADWNGRVYVWETATRQSRLVFTVPDAKAGDVALSPDGRSIAVATRTASTGTGTGAGTADERVVELRSAATGKLEQTLSVPGSSLAAPQFSPDGRYLTCSTGRDGKLLLWTLGTSRHVVLATEIGYGGPRYAWRPDSQQLAIVSRSGAVDRYDVASGKADSRITKALGDHRAWSVAWLPGSALLAVGCMDRTVQVVDTAGWILQAPLEGIGGLPTALYASHDGQRLVVDSTNNVPQVWDVASRRALGLQARQLGPVRALAYSPDGSLVATAGVDSQLHLWEAATARHKASFGSFGSTSIFPNSGVLAMAFDKLGSRLVTVADVGQVTVWEAQSGKVLSRRSLPKWPGSNNGCHISADASRIVYFNQDDECVVSNVANGTQAVIRKVPEGDYLKAVALSANGDLLALSYRDGLVEIWDVNRQSLLKELDRPSQELLSFAFSGDNQRLAVWARYGDIHLWDLATYTRITDFKRSSTTGYADIKQIALSHDGSQAMLALGGGDLTLWSTDGGRAARLVGHGHTVTALAFNGDGSHLASSDESGDLRLWNTDPSLPLEDLPGHIQSISALTLASNSSTLASASQDGTVRIWDFRTGKPDLLLNGFHGAPLGLDFVQHFDIKNTAALAVLDHKGYASIIARSGESVRVQSRLPAEAGRFNQIHALSSGQILLAGPESGTKGGIVLWNRVTGTYARILNAGRSTKVAVSPGRDKLAVTVSSREMFIRPSIHIYDIAKLQPGQSPRLLTVVALHGARGNLTSLAFSATGQTLAAGDVDGSVLLWNTSTGNGLAEIQGHTGSVLAVAFSPDKKHLASAGRDGSIRLMDLGGGGKTRVLTGHKGAVHDILFSSGGRVLVSAGSDATIRYWDANTGRLLRVLSADPATSTVAGAPAAATDSPAAPSDAATTPTGATEDALPATEPAATGTAAIAPATAADADPDPDAANADADGTAEDSAAALAFDIGAHSGLYMQIPEALLDYRVRGADVLFISGPPNLYFSGLGYHRRYGYTLPPEAELATLSAPVRAELDALVQADLEWRRTHDWPAPRPLPGTLVEPPAAPETMPVEFVDDLLQQDAKDATALDPTTPAPAEATAPATAPEATPTTK